MQTKRHLPRLALVAALFVLAACSPPKHPHAISQSDADLIAAQAPEDLRGVQFGDRYELVGVTGAKGGAGFDMQLVWKSHKKQKLEHLVAVHAVDSEGKIVGQADYPQKTDAGEVAANALWRDTLTIPYEKLTGATAIGIGLLGDGQKWLLADRGPRDWDNRRLLFPLPKDLPAKGSTLAGFLEAANAKNIVGWAWDRAEPGKRVEVEISDGPRVVAKVKADAFREDLQKGNIGDGNHGFRIEPPAELKDGKPHEIHATIVGEGFELKNSPKTLQTK